MTHRYTEEVAPVIRCTLGPLPVSCHCEELDDGWPESEKHVFQAALEYGSRKKDSVNG